MQLPTALVFMAACGPVLAQTDAAEPAPLAGPEVKQTRPERLEQGLTMGQTIGMQMGQSRQLPMRDVRALIEAMSEDTAAAGIRITPEQTATIEAITREHRAAVRAHRQTHAERLKDLRFKAGVVPERIPDDQLSRSQRAARTALQQLYRSGPTDADLQTRVFAELTEAQRAHIDAEIGRLLERRSRERRQKQYADELNAEPVDTAAFFNADGTVNLEALPAPLKRQLAKVDEPQRTKRLRRILDRFAKRPAQPAEPTPDGPAAPTVDAVQVPNPD
ncbi:MAG: hypothetical protein AAFR76_01955 [Planctomycetota bacterium]